MSFDGCPLPNLFDKKYNVKKCFWLVEIITICQKHKLIHDEYKIVHNSRNKTNFPKNIYKNQNNTRCVSRTIENG